MWDGRSDGRPLFKNVQRCSPPPTIDPSLSAPNFARPTIRPTRMFVLCPSFEHSFVDGRTDGGSGPVDGRTDCQYKILSLPRPTDRPTDHASKYMLRGMHSAAAGEHVSVGPSSNLSFATRTFFSCRPSGASKLPSSTIDHMGPAPLCSVRLMMSSLWLGMARSTSAQRRSVGRLVSKQAALLGRGGKKMKIGFGRSRPAGRPTCELLPSVRRPSDAAAAGAIVPSVGLKCVGSSLSLMALLLLLGPPTPTESSIV